MSGTLSDVGKMTKAHIQMRSRQALDLNHGGYQCSLWTMHASYFQIDWNVRRLCRKTADRSYYLLFSDALDAQCLGKKLSVFWGVLRKSIDRKAIGVFRNWIIAVTPVSMLDIGSPTLLFESGLAPRVLIPNIVLIPGSYPSHDMLLYVWMFIVFGRQNLLRRLQKK